MSAMKSGTTNISHILSFILMNLDINTVLFNIKMVFSPIIESKTILR